MQIIYLTIPSDSYFGMHFLSWGYFQFLPSFMHLKFDVGDFVVFCESTSSSFFVARIKRLAPSYFSWDRWEMFHFRLYLALRRLLAAAKRGAAAPQDGGRAKRSAERGT